MNPGPVVSCIMPTFNRRHFIRKAVEYFLRQDYQWKQLVIVDDGSDSIRDLIPNIDSVLYIGLRNKTPLGEKRNIAIENCSGDIIMHWDDDDWYSDTRISFQVGSLLKENANVCGLGGGLYYDIVADQFWRCQEQLHEILFYAAIIGGSLCYQKSLWEKVGKFYSRAVLAEDSYFLRKIPKDWQILKLPNRDTLVYIRHPSNTWRFRCGQLVNPAEWIRVEDQDVMPQDDLTFYKELSPHLKN